MGSNSRPTVLWGLIAAHAAAAGRRVSLADVCAVAVCSAQASGAWLAAASSRGPDFVMCVTDKVSEQLAELQLTLGEGPGRDVLATAAPVLAADLGDQESGRRWPAFTPEAREAGAAAVFAFPLVIGAIRAGVDRPVPQLSRSPVQPAARGLPPPGRHGDRAAARRPGRPRRPRRPRPRRRTVCGRERARVPAGRPVPRQAGTGRMASPPIWPSTGLRSTRPRACSPCSSASPPRKPSPGSGPTLMPGTGGSPTWPVTSSPAAFAWTAIQAGTPGHDPTGTPNRTAPGRLARQAAPSPPQREGEP